jgi:two-component system chemotaxis response regulator CheY
MEVKKSHSYDLRDLNIMVVDDNRHMRFLVKTILHAFHIRNISEAGDGADALKLLQTFPADLIISDWAMDPIDGLDLTRMIRTSSDSANPYVPVILLTGHTETHRVQEARDAGVTEFLAKPISSAALYRRLVTIIERPRTFIKTRMYTGPDRRRREIDYQGKDRRQS